MISYYVIYSPATREFVSRGRYSRPAINVNAAKHFTSKWSAENWLKNMREPERWIIKLISAY